ncbi:MAG: hypothetical protein CL851_03530 [Crocinitomicaceae bacterium]|nr:hypothetical protein [Crocinitomicaceae bacterium]|tara:strand:+ start:7853 stop:8740 length:888 start_codon:yes stop_codon:yes gene_type:complete
MIKKSAIVRVKGGFGNQLFQIMFANELVQRGLDVTVSTKNFKRATKKGITKNINGINLERNLILPLDYFSFDETKDSVLYLYEFAEKLMNFKVIEFLVRFFKLESFRSFNDSTDTKIEYAKHNLFTGYWQDIDLFIKNKDFILNSISNNEKIKKGLDIKPIPGSTLLHVRRKDYVNMGEDLSLNFYSEALDYAARHIKNFSYTIFTDDYEWVSKKQVFIDAVDIKSPVLDMDDTIQTFSEMLKFENFIVGNSTFSLIPGILRETSTSKIIIAEPWFKNSNPIKNFPKHWIKINNL